MCLAVPMELTELRNGTHGVAELDGSRHEVNLGLIENPAVGDYVIVHAGFALHKIDEADAMESLRILREAAEFAEKKEREE